MSRNRFHSETYKQFRQMIVVCTILTISIIFITCFLYGNVILQQSKQSVIGMVSRYRENLQDQITEYIQITQTIAYDDSVRNYFAAQSSYDRYLYSQKISKLFSNLKMIKSGLEGFYLFEAENDASQFLALKDSQNKILESLHSASSPEMIGFYPYYLPYSEASLAEYAAIVGCPVYSLDTPENKSDVIGYTAIAVSEKTIEECLSELCEGNGLRYALTDEESNVILGEQLEIPHSLYAKALSNGNAMEENIFTSQQITFIPSMKTFLAVQTDNWMLLQDLFRITLKVVILVILLMTTQMLLVFHLSRQIASPLENISEAIRKMDANPTHNRSIKEEGNSDFRVLSSSINKLLASCIFRSHKATCTEF